MHVVIIIKVQGYTTTNGQPLQCISMAIYKNTDKEIHRDKDADKYIKTIVRTDMTKE